MKVLYKSILTTVFLCIVYLSVFAQQYAVYTGAFYNLENLFDTALDTTVLDSDFTPTGAYQWTEERYWRKQANIAKVISRLGKRYNSTGPAFLGVCEIENRKVLEDLIGQPSLASSCYKIVHYDSPDRRGIDVAFLYNPKLFVLEHSTVLVYRLPSQPDYVSRDILLVSGTLAGERVHVFVNHWPSRFGGKSSELRAHAASILREATDSIYSLDAQAKIIVMGDFNDDPVDKSLSKVLAARKTIKEVDDKGFYNSMWSFYERGIGTLGYQGKWNLFDQIIVSKPLLGTDRSSLKFWKSEIYNPEYLITQEGRYKGYPLRTFSSNVFQNGYSDHFPVLIYLVKQL